MIREISTSAPMLMREVAVNKTFYLSVAHRYVKTPIERWMRSACVDGCQLPLVSIGVYAYLALRADAVTYSPSTEEWTASFKNAGQLDQAVGIERALTKACKQASSSNKNFVDKGFELTFCTKDSTCKCRCKNS